MQILFSFDESQNVGNILTWIIWIRKKQVQCGLTYIGFEYQALGIEDILIWISLKWNDLNCPLIQYGLKSVIIKIRKLMFKWVCRRESLLLILFKVEQNMILFAFVLLCDLFVCIITGVNDNDVSWKSDSKDMITLIVKVSYYIFSSYRSKLL